MQYPSTISQVTDDNEQYGFFGKVGPSLPNSHDVWLFFGYNQHLCFKLLQEFHKITTFRDIRQSAFAVSVQCYVTDVHSHSVLLLMLLSRSGVGGITYTINDMFWISLLFMVYNYCVFLHFKFSDSPKSEVYRKLKEKVFYTHVQIVADFL